MKTVASGQQPAVPTLPAGAPPDHAERVRGAATASDANDHVGDILRCLTDRHRDCNDFQITSIDQRVEGWSWHTFLVEARCSCDENPLGFAAKRAPREGIVDVYDVEREAAILRDAGRAGVPAPGVICAHPTDGEWQGFFVMEKVDGNVPLAWDVKQSIPSEAARVGLGREVADALATLHRFDVSAVAPVLQAGVAPEDAGAAEARRWSQIYREAAVVRSPLVDYALGWLSHRSDRVSGRAALVHNDVRVGNLVVGGDGHLRSILDWETASVTDPAADLAKFLLPTFRNKAGVCGNIITVEDFVDAYAGAAGWRPEQSTLDYWIVMELVKTIIGATRVGRAYASGRADDVRFASMEYHMKFIVRWLLKAYDEKVWGH